MRRNDEAVRKWDAAAAQEEFLFGNGEDSIGSQECTFCPLPIFRREHDMAFAHPIRVREAVGLLDHSRPSPPPIGLLTTRTSSMPDGKVVLQSESPPPVKRVVLSARLRAPE